MPLNWLRPYDIGLESEKKTRARHDRFIDYPPPRQDSISLITDSSSDPFILLQVSEKYQTNTSARTPSPPIYFCNFFCFTLAKKTMKNLNLVIYICFFFCSPSKSKFQSFLLDSAILSCCVRVLPVIMLFPLSFPTSFVARLALSDSYFSYYFFLSHTSYLYIIFFLPHLWLSWFVLLAWAVFSQVWYFFFFLFGESWKCFFFRVAKEDNTQVGEIFITFIFDSCSYFFPPVYVIGSQPTCFSLPQKNTLLSNYFPPIVSRYLIGSRVMQTKELSLESKAKATISQKRKSFLSRRPFDWQRLKTKENKSSLRKQNEPFFLRLALPPYPPRKEKHTEWSAKVSFFNKKMERGIGENAGNIFNFSYTIAYRYTYINFFLDLGLIFLF